MKKLTLLCAVLLFGAVAMAETPTLKMLVRPDLVKMSGDAKGVAYETNKEDEGMTFQMKVLRILYQQKLNDDTSFTGYFNFLKEFAPHNNSVSPATTTDMTGQGIKWAYIDHMIAENWTLRMGKMGIAWGGWENAWGAIDQYSYSAIYSSPLGSNMAIGSQDRTGVGVIFKGFEGHTFTFQYVNNGHLEYNQAGGMYGLEWKGSFMDGMVQPVVWYFVDPYTEQKAGGTGIAADTKAANDTYMGAGARVKVEKFLFDLDYSSKTVGNTTIGSGADLTHSGIVAWLHYDAGNFRPQFKYSTTDVKELQGNEAKKSYNQSIWHLALEYYPVIDQSFRYHIAYQADTLKYDSGSTSYAGGNADRTFNYIMVGCAATF